MPPEHTFKAEVKQLIVLDKAPDLGTGAPTIAFV